MRRLLWVALCLLGAPDAGAETKLDLSKIENRKQVLKERDKMDCAGIYKQSQLRLGIVGKLSLQAGELAKLTEMTVGLGQKRREFCELYRATPEFNTEEYLAVYGGLDKQESDLKLIVDRAASGPAPAASPKTPVPADATAWASEFETISVDPAAGIPGAISRMEKAIAEATPLSYAVLSKGRPVSFDDLPEFETGYAIKRDGSPAAPSGLQSAPLPWWVQLPLLALAGGVGWFVAARSKS